jgi:hypothetical protein
VVRVGGRARRNRADGGRVGQGPLDAGPPVLILVDRQGVGRARLDCLDRWCEVHVERHRLGHSGVGRAEQDRLDRRGEVLAAQDCLGRRDLVRGDQDCLGRRDLVRGDQDCLAHSGEVPAELDRLNRRGRARLGRLVQGRAGPYLGPAEEVLAPEAAEAAGLVARAAALARLPEPAADPSARSSSSADACTPRLPDESQESPGRSPATSWHRGGS